MRESQLYKEAIKEQIEHMEKLQAQRTAHNKDIVQDNENLHINNSGETAQKMGKADLIAGVAGLVILSKISYLLLTIRKQLNYNISLEELLMNLREQGFLRCQENYQK